MFIRAGDYQANYRPIPQRERQEQRVVRLGLLYNARSVLTRMLGVRRTGAVNLPLTDSI